MRVSVYVYLYTKQMHFKFFRVFSKLGDKMEKSKRISNVTRNFSAARASSILSVRLSVGECAVYIFRFVFIVKAASFPRLLNAKRFTLLFLFGWLAIWSVSRYVRVCVCIGVVQYG